MRVLATIVLVLALIQTAGWATSVEERGADEEARLLELERESHKRWQVRDRAYLGNLLSENYRLVVMNGTVEDRDIVLGKKKPKSMKKNGPRFRVQELRAEPEEVVIDGDTATVLGGNPSQGNNRRPPRSEPPSFDERLHTQGWFVETSLALNDADPQT